MKRLSSIILTMFITSTASMAYANEDVENSQIEKAKTAQSKKVVAAKSDKVIIAKTERKLAKNSNSNVCRDLKFGGLARSASFMSGRKLPQVSGMQVDVDYEDENGRVNLYLQAIDMAEDLFLDSIATSKKEYELENTSYISKINTHLCEEQPGRIIQL